MQQFVYSIFDRATSEYSAPFFANDDSLAFRLVRGSFSPQSQLVMYPSDYVIMRLGRFDSESGEIVSDITKVEEIKVLIPAVLRDNSLDGTFERGVSDEKTKDTPAQS